jgi:hypothetical protein
VLVIDLEPVPKITAFAGLDLRENKGWGRLMSFE